MKEPIRILLIDDDESLCQVLEHQLNEEGFEVETANDGNTGLSLFNKNRFNCVVTDLAMPDMDGMEVIRRIRSQDTGVVIILITAFGTIESAVEACHTGADDYITKPFGIEQLRFTLEKALRQRQLEKENVSFRAQLNKRFGLKRLIGQSVAIQEVYRLIEKVAQRDTTVLIQGESGTGKELVARAIHTVSQRKGGPFVPVDCAAIPETLLESELFGHVKGAFTGAITERKGKFEMAHQGTLFLDEIGDMKEEMQAKLLRVLQERQVVKVGSDRAITINVRIVAATHHDLVRAVRESTFRQDLYYRLAVVIIQVPPLRERLEDIKPLVDHFIEKYAKEEKITVKEDVYRKLKGYSWPGNVRELENAIERAIVLADGNTIEVENIPDLGIHAQDQDTPSEGRTLEEIEKQAITNALRKAQGNQSRAAKILGVPRHVLIYRMKKWDIQSK